MNQAFYVNIRMPNCTKTSYSSSCYIAGFSFNSTPGNNIVTEWWLIYKMHFSLFCIIYIDNHTYVVFLFTPKAQTVMPFTTKNVT